MLAALALCGAACGGSDEGSADEGADTTTIRTAPEGEVLERAGAESASAPAQINGTALLERVALAHHDGYDRLVFQFTNGLPGYRIEYVELPLSEDGSGRPVEVDGSAVLLVRMEPASGFDLNTAEGVLVYDGPRRIEGSDAGTSTVREVVRTGDFEAVLSWAVGLDERVSFRVQTIDGPPRLLVDFPA